MMKRTGGYILAGLLLTAAAAFGPMAVSAAEAGNPYDQVASEEEMSAHQEVGMEGMYPIYGGDVADGVYGIEVESSSPMFRVEKAELTVREGEMRAVLTLSGTGYRMLYMGTGAEAAKAEPADFIPYTEDEEGKFSYEVPVEALDLPIDCAAFSRNKEKWYDRQILFQAQSLPREAVRTELPDYEALRQAAKERRIAALKAEKEEGQAREPEDQTAAVSPEPALIEMEDGEYAIAVELTGGSGRSTVNSPAGLIVLDGHAFARLQWSSSSYDYMIVGGKQYFPVNEEGYSTFEIPITAFNEPVPVIADTTAMSTPHEVEYTLIFHGDEIMSADETPQAAAKKVVYMAVGIAAVCGAVSWIKKRRKRTRR